MFRITIAFLLCLVMQFAYGEELFSVDAERIRQVAIDAALLEHPELLPGDLADDNQGMVTIYCWTRDESYKCQAQVNFKILSSKKEDILREGDTCSQTIESKSVVIIVNPDGSVLRVNSSGRSTGWRTIDCPV